MDNNTSARGTPIASPSSRRDRAFVGDILADAVRSLGLRIRDWSLGTDIMYAVYVDSDSFIGTVKPTSAGLVGEGFAAAGRDALLRLIREYDRLLDSSPGPNSSVSP